MAWGLLKERKIWGFPMGKFCANSEDKDEDQEGPGWDTGASRPGSQTTVLPLGWQKDAGTAV